ncbi:MAG: 2-hydroxyacid dehydrogenase, partial [Alphaproteobacteria bacterium]
MREYVLLAVLSYHRQAPAYHAQQQQNDWTEHFQPPAAERSVGIMGLGVMGQAAAASLAAHGFAVSGWSRGAKRIDNVRCFHGKQGLGPFLRATEILVCLLPLTSETENILDERLFAQLPTGASLINVARGAHLVEADLLEALASGQIAYATLDVFATEPLPGDHGFWRHPQITMTPHVASISDPRSVADQVIENIRRARDGETLLNQVDRLRGY